MKRFLYWRDPVFLVCCAAYALNRFALKVWLQSDFLTGYFNDLLLIPCALPLALLLQRRLGLRLDDGYPGWKEISMHLIVWSILFEGLGPMLVRSAVSDPMDVAAYVVGGFGAYVCWRGARFVPASQVNSG